MLIFLTTAAHRYTITSLLESGAVPLRDRVLPISYGEFLSWRKLPRGSYVFADVDRLSAAEAEAVSVRIAILAAAWPETRLLNHPQRSLGRLALLEALHAAGINRFQARPAAASMLGLRFPVFIREAVEHRGAVGGLIATPEALAEALQALSTQAGSLHGYLVIEFVDVRNADGYFEKYSVLRIGDRYIASDLSFNDRWICKGEADEAEAPDYLARDEAFQRDNPHVNQLRPIFERAGIDYGRVDYAFADGQLQVFEINSNPMLPALADGSGAYRDWARRYVAALTAGLAALPAFEAPLRWQALPGAIGPERFEGGSRARSLLRRVLRAVGLLQRESRLLSWWRRTR